MSYKGSAIVETNTVRLSKNYLALVGLVLILVGCGDEGGENSEPVEESPFSNNGTYTLVQCTVYYWDYQGWQHCGLLDQLTVRANQPVFTALNDCLIAKGHEQDNDPLVLDDSQEDRDRGWADELYCAAG